MLNEWVYCPRLAVLEHVQREWADSPETVDGRRVHRRVDKEQGEWPEQDALEGREVARSLWLTSEADGITARIDLVEALADGTVRPVDYKRSAAPDVEHGAWLPERVQVCAQAVVLRANGYQVREGALWFAASRKRVRVELDDKLLAETHGAVREFRATIDAGTTPPPLVDSPRCVGCSLAPICMPDELGLLGGDSGDPLGAEEERLSRRLVPARDDGEPLHVVTPGAYVGLRGDELLVRRSGEELGRAPLPLTSQVSLYGRVQVSTQALARLMRLGIPTAFFSSGGWFNGFVQGMPHGNVVVRVAQHRAAADLPTKLKHARCFVAEKIANQRTLLRRHGRRRSADDPEQRKTVDKALRAMAAARRRVASARDLDELRGFEGNAARHYFGTFDVMLTAEARLLGFKLEQRNRRPPRDPVNATLSFAYAMLSRELTHVCVRVGLEPLLGFLHEPRHGRPALALDLMEGFRPILGDSVALLCLNNGELTPRHFITRGGACNLTASGRKAFIKAWERRMDQLVTHPVFGYRISYRRVLEVQTRLFARVLLGELESFPRFEVR